MNQHEALSAFVGASRTYPALDLAQAVHLFETHGPQAHEMLVALIIHSDSHQTIVRTANAIPNHRAVSNQETLDVLVYEAEVTRIMTALPEEGQQKLVAYLHQGDPSQPEWLDKFKNLFETLKYGLFTHRISSSQLNKL